MRLSCSEAWMGEVVECPLEWRMDVYASTNLEDREDGDTYSGSPS